MDVGGTGVAGHELADNTTDEVDLSFQDVGVPAHPGFGRFHMCLLPKGDSPRLYLGAGEPGTVFFGRAAGMLDGCDVKLWRKAGWRVEDKVGRYADWQKGTYDITLAAKRAVMCQRRDHQLWIGSRLCVLGLCSASETNSVKPRYWQSYAG